MYVCIYMNEISLQSVLLYIRLIKTQFLLCLMIIVFLKCICLYGTPYGTHIK